MKYKNRYSLAIAAAKAGMSIKTARKYKAAGEWPERHEKPRDYRELTGWEAPINGGLSSRQLTAEQKRIDKEARLIITEELGHSREQITVNYLAR